MKKTSLFFFLLMAACTIPSIAQSNYYYDKGVYWARGATDNPYWQKNAYNEWKTGEQNGEAESARAVISCYLKGYGVPKNVSKAVGLINKWYKKDQKICMLGALLNIPQKYNFIPYKLSFDGLVDFENISFDDLGVSADISKALYYAKYAKDNHHNSLIASSNEMDLFYIIEGLCYKHGAGGYKKDLIQAARRLNYVVDRYGYHDYGPMLELISSSSSLEELCFNMSETSRNVANGVSHDMETLLNLAATEGSGKPVREGYINDFLFKVDVFVDEFWKLSKEEKATVYNNSNPSIRRIYDNSLIYKVSELLRKGEVSQLDIDAIKSCLDDYPGTEAVSKVRNELGEYELNMMEQFAILNDCDSYAKASGVLCGLRNEGILSDEPSEKLRNNQSKLLRYFETQRKNLNYSWNGYELSRKADFDILPSDVSLEWYGGYIWESHPGFYEQSRKTLSEIRKIKKSCAYIEMKEFDEIEQFANQSFAFAEALGFYTDESGSEYNSTKKREANKSDLQRFLENYPNTIFQWYAEALLAKEFGVDVKDLQTKKDKDDKHIIMSNTNQANIQNHGLFLVNYAFSPISQHSFGFTIGGVKKFGWYISAMTNGRFDFQSDQTATLDDNGVNNEYLWSGEVATSRFSATAGGLFAISKFGYVYAGLGYGVRNRLWYTMSDQTVSITPGFYKGLAVEVGLQFNLGEHVLVSAGALTQSSGAYYEMKFGIGYKF